MKTWKMVALASLMCLFVPQEILAVNDIVTPGTGTQYLPYSNIATDGNRGMGLDVRVKLFLNGAVGADSGVLAGPPMGTQWAHNFPAPSGNWTISDNWSCQLFVGNQTDPSDTNTYKVVSGIMP